MVYLVTRQYPELPWDLRAANAILETGLLCDFYDKDKKIKIEINSFFKNFLNKFKTMDIATFSGEMFEHFLVSKSVESFCRAKNQLTSLSQDKEYQLNLPRLTTGAAGMLSDKNIHMLAKYVLERIS